MSILMEWSIKTASAEVGGLSKPSKMPGYGTSLPAPTCQIGSKLVDVKGSVCEGCYALKGAYIWNGVRAALQRRYDILMRCRDDAEARERWISAMAFLLNERGRKWKGGGSIDHGHFRWHDSGDLQGVWHLDMIAQVAERTPAVRHWLPTRELPTVHEHRRLYGAAAIPSNLNIRVSANRVGAPVPHVEGTTASGVHVIQGNPENGAKECPAIHNDNACGDCRRCWDRDEPAISYLKH